MSLNDLETLTDISQSVKNPVMEWIREEESDEGASATIESYNKQLREGFLLERRYIIQQSNIPPTHRRSIKCG